MAKKDIRSGLKQTIAGFGAVSGSTHTGAIIDTKDFGNGFMAALLVTNYTSGTIALSIRESSAANMSGDTAVTGDQLIGTLPSVSAVSVAGGTLQTVGVISNLRYVRVDITGGVATAVEAIVTQAAQDEPFVNN